MMARYLPSIFGGLELFEQRHGLVDLVRCQLRGGVQTCAAGHGGMCAVRADLVAVLHICARCGDIAHQLILRRTGGRAQLLRRTQNHVVMACSSSWSDTDTYVPYWVIACVTALWPNFWPSE